MKKVKVHVTDDHLVLIEGITAMINTTNDISVVGYSLRAKEVIQWFENNQADVLVLDVNMPGGYDGIYALKKVKKNNPDLKVIMLSSYDDPRFVKEVIEQGADGFIEKTSAGDLIIEGIRTVYKGEQFFSEQTKEGLFKIAMGKKVKYGVMPSKLDSFNLSDREIEVLKLISKEYNTTEIADILCLSKLTVESYRKNLLKKLNVKNSVGLALFAAKYKLL